MINNPGLVITEAHIASLFGEAFLKGATMYNAINGFKSCGIEPFNPNIFQENDFAASATTDRPLEIGCDINIDQRLRYSTYFTTFNRLCYYLSTWSKYYKQFKSK